MNSEKTKEIKKALECCKQNQINETCEYCDDCPASYTDWIFEEGILECDIDLLQKSLILINELEREVEGLKCELQKTRKETAREIIEMLVGYTFEDDGWTWTVSQEDIQWLAEKYGVEVE